MLKASWAIDRYSYSLTKPTVVENICIFNIEALESPSALFFN